MQTEHEHRDPLDDEIERDVEELRRLLDGIEGPVEPHPAYFQNFVVRVRDRLDADRARHRRWNRIGRFASVATAAIVVLVVATTVFDSGVDLPTLQGPGRAVTSSPTTPQLPSPSLFSDEGSRIVLSKSDVRMLNAIMTDDDDEMFRAMASANQY